MEPDFSLGDLVVARKGAMYEEDHRVVYQHPQVGYVFHRIVDQDKDEFTLKGDNNDWLDSFHPTESDIVGKYWFVIPGGGTAVRKLREPVYFASFTLISIVIIASLFLFEKKETVLKKIQNRRLNMENHPPRSSGDTRQELLILVGFIALVALVFGIISFSRPLTKMIADDLVYTHAGEFNYTAKIRENIYDSTAIETGEPVYLRLTCDVDMTFLYQFSAPRMTGIEQKEFSGIYQVSAKISDIDGWNRSFELVPETEFAGSEFDAQMSLDICQAQALIAEKEEKTETKNRWYNLTIYPEITVAGSVEDTPFDDIYRPEIIFQIDSSIMRLPDGLEVLALDQEGSIKNVREVSNFLLIFGQELDIEVARRIAMIAFGLSLAAAIFPAWSLFRDWRKSDITRIQVQYHPLLVDVKSGSSSTQLNQIVEVASFADLAKMAERYGAMILHESESSFHRYSVLDEQSVYQYTMDVFTEESLFPDVENFKKSLRSALDEDQFELYYQPIVLLKDKSVIGVEAFIRWNHPDFGILYPADFISQAEICDLIPEIDRWVSRKACRQLKEWKELGLPLVPISINISPDTIVDNQFLEDISSIVLENACDPEFLQIEINRSNLVFQDEDIKQHLSQLNDLGIRLAIDNFATDAANQINQVSQMPIQSVKIDRTIVQGIQEDDDKQRLINAVAKMAKSLQVEVVAQGVESKEQVAILKKQDIEVAQGFFLGNPIRANEIVTLLEKPKTAAKKSKKE